MTTDRTKPVAQQGPSVLAITADDDRYIDSRRAAMVLAAREDLELILYDWDAPQLLGDPLPSVFSAEGTDTAVPDRLDEGWLERTGHQAVADQVRESIAAGVTTTAWLPSKHGMKALSDYARDHRARVVVVPTDLREDDLDATFEGMRVVVA